MRKYLFMILTIAAFIMNVASPSRGDDALEKLTHDKKIADFKVEYIYDNDLGKVIGARFTHVPSGFVLDFLRIQSVPQAFIWVNSPPPSDQGEPHTCEHLLLGKGTKGRYVASLEDMSMGSSSAFTMQLQTCYHFHTTAGTAVFFNLLQAKLDALLHPNFTDEEIRREVANMGYSIDPADSTLRLEEKGTVYNEMVRSYESPWGNLGRKIGFLLYGTDHPVSYSSGGFPDAIRTMTPDDMRKFIARNYHLNNMGMIAAIPDDISLEDFLKKTSGILKTIEPDAKPDGDPATFDDRLPSPRTAAEGILEESNFPSENESDPGMILFGWPPERNLEPLDEILLDIFIDNFAGGETSNLYEKFIDSNTRVMDIGSNAVFGWLDNDPGEPVYIGFDNVRREAADLGTIDSIRAIILSEMTAIAQFKDHSPELASFNDRARNKIISRRRDLRKILSTPPRFGYRGTGSMWYFLLKQLQKASGFRRNLTMSGDMDEIEKLLDSGKNFWPAYLEKWKILGTKPFGVGARANPDLLKESEDARKQRIDDFVQVLKKKYGVSSDEEAMLDFKADYDAKTAQIEEEAKKIPMPGFVDRPPMTLDDQLRYTVAALPGGGPLVESTFESMTGATAGLAFNMHVIPENYLVYVSALPFLMTDVGVVRRGERLTYDKMIERIRQEILSVDTYFSENNRTGRVELVVRGAGSDLDESIKAVDWMETVLFNPDWSVGNLPRIRDAVDLKLKALRNTTRGAEESWVQDPLNAYWKQNDSLILSSNSFLTRIHNLHRLRWMLKEADSEETLSEFSGFMSMLGQSGSLGRESLDSAVTCFIGNTAAAAPENARDLALKFDSLRENAKSLTREAAEDLQTALDDIPDNSLISDWKYLCGEMTGDLAVKPEAVLSDLNNVVDFLRHTGNVRGFLISNSHDQKALADALGSFVEKLDNSPVRHQSYSSDHLIISRLRERTPGLVKPVYVGLVTPGTRSGVFMNTAGCADYLTVDRDSLLTFLSARLYGGGGAHSMFMKTWGAGLAYSNGLRSNESTGRIIYYAERCPDLAQTMQFVVDELRKSDHDPSLAEYAVAQAFVGSRGGSSFENRGEAMAADLADGVTPEVVSRFRKSILDIRKDKNLADELYSRMEATYGKVLPGYGPNGNDVDDAIYFIIGPEAQFESYEDYLHGVEGDVTLYRLYPRDFWMVRSN